MPLRFIHLHAKLVVAILAGLAFAIMLQTVDLRPITRMLIGWNAGVAIYLLWSIGMMRRADVESIRKRAAEEDEGAFAILLLSIVATVASLAAIVMELGALKGVHGLAVMPHVLLATATILLSWTFMHTIFSFHYAHEYYGERHDGAIGGLKFPDDDEPDYRDFLYFSLVIGMTSQVSDVAITSKVIRRMAAVHGVLSFFFNLTVLALTVNMVSNLI